MSQLFEHLKVAVESELQPQRRVDLPKLCDGLELPYAPDNPELTKREYILSRAEKLRDDPEQTRRVAANFTEQYPVAEGNKDTFMIEEMLWADSDYPEISKKLRREIAGGLEGEALCVDTDGFLDALGRLWVLQSREQKLLETWVIGIKPNSLRWQIEQYVINNSNNWSIEDLFNKLGALDCSHVRFGKLIETLAGPDVRPDEPRQRSFATAVNKVLSCHGLELAATGEADGYPTFTLQKIGTNVVGRPKNLIFASSVKPDLRFRDAVNNDIEIVTHVDKILVYDRPIPATGLRWRDLQAWWAELNECKNDQEAKKTLYHRLLASLPESSPPQRLLFETFFKHFRKAVPDLPALLPEVWLHYDPKTINQRGRSALFRQRMDFLLLISPSTRVVIEVDGKHHYSDKTGRADPIAYTKMVADDRDLRLCGYDLYRFGGSELQMNGGAQLLGKFFDDLFKKYHVSPLPVVASAV